MMLVEDIETMVRDLILYAFSDGAGGIDQVKLDAAIKAIDSQREALHKQFKKGLAHYLQNAGLDQPKLNPSLATQSFQVMAPEQRAEGVRAAHPQRIHRAVVQQGPLGEGLPAALGLDR